MIAAQRADYGIPHTRGARVRGNPTTGTRSRIAFADKGSHELKGVPDRWPVLAVRDARG